MSGRGRRHDSTGYNNYPFDEVCAKAQELIDAGADCYQKFTCAGCGQRLTIDISNKFYREATCDKCGALTNIEKDGCNYMVTFGVR